MRRALTKIRIGIRKELPQELEINKPFNEIRASDIYAIIGKKQLLGWADITEDEYEDL